MGIGVSIGWGGEQRCSLGSRSTLEGVGFYSGWVGKRREIAVGLLPFIQCGGDFQVLIEILSNAYKNKNHDCVS